MAATTLGHLALSDVPDLVRAGGDAGWMGRVGLVLLAFAGIAACSGEPSRATSGTSNQPDCASAEIAGPNGACVAVGVAPDACASGFVSDERGGCEPVLPDDPCAPGTMAIPGEVVCRSVAPCAEGRFGQIPVEQSTQHVDASYSGVGSDGSADHPWTTVQAAIDGAAPGAVIAIAAGQYDEALVIQKQVRLWGVCPDRVTLSAPAASFAVVTIENAGANGTEIHDLAVTGAQNGIAASGSEGIVVDRVHIHDTQSRGLDIEDPLGPTSIAITRSLVEACGVVGIFAGGVDMTLESSVVRDTKTAATDLLSGRAIEIVNDISTGRRGKLAMRGSLLDRNRDVGIFCEGSDAVVEGTLIRDTRAHPNSKQSGRGINVERAPDTPERCAFMLKASVIQGSDQSGVLVAAADATIEQSVIRGTRSSPWTEAGGRGVFVEHDPANGERGTLVVESSLVDDNVGFGVVVQESDASLDGVLVRATAPDPTAGGFGDGIAVVAGPDFDGTLDFTAGRIEASARAGITSFGAVAHVGASVFTCDTIDLDGEAANDRDYALDDAGNNHCECDGQARTCRVLTSGLVPPQPLATP